MFATRILEEPRVIRDRDRRCPNTGQGAADGFAGGHGLGILPAMSLCPGCHGPVARRSHLFRPFCSERCQRADLGRWLSDEYRIPSDPVSLPAENVLPTEEEAVG